VSGVTFGPQTCGDLDQGSSREWLLPDGLGGYATGTVTGLRTRGYHALLVVAGGHAGSRRAGLLSLDPVLTSPSGTRVRLGVHEWRSGAVQPQGHRYLERFDLVDGLPTWRLRIGDVVLERTYATAHGASAFGAVYRLLAGGPVDLAVEAVCTWRDVHGERFESGGELPVTPVDGGVVVADAYRLAGPGWRPGGQWYGGFHLREEAARGLAAEEDAVMAGAFTARLEPGATLEVLAWSGDLSATPPPAAELVRSARARRASLLAAAAPGDEVAATLTAAADQFVIRRDGTPDVVAGYPWFGAWSRDTLTSYEGLFLATGRAGEGRDLLRAYAGTLSEGMLANTADTGALEYNTADATMWLLHAVGRHAAVTGDDDLAAELAPALERVVGAHLAGTRHGLRVDADGLLTQGAPGLALTWMDARVDGVAVTPRAGKPVEVNALWVAGLATLCELGGRLGRDVAGVAALHQRARDAFQARFPRGDGTLFDVVDGPGGDDPTVRPNQLLAWSLPYAPMDAPAPALPDLVTPLGLRTRVPGTPGYRGSHHGDREARDSAYHEGTVWPWLVGPYLDARRRDDPAFDVAVATGGLAAHLGEYGLGSVSETADGDAPHAATGCPFQAWSVAELLRARRG
jgi:predicted glycogen debranching enzyme